MHLSRKRALSDVGIANSQFQVSFLGLDEADVLEVSVARYATVA
jgi:hypothetical protein